MAERGSGSSYGWGGASTGDRYKPGSGTASVITTPGAIAQLRESGSGMRADQQKILPPASSWDDNDNYANTESPACPMCDGGAFQLGQLGNTVHHRCRNCGFTFS